MAAGAVGVGVYPTSPSNEVQYVLAHSGATIVVAEDQEQVDKILEVGDRLPAVRHVVVPETKGLRSYKDPRLLSWEELEERGERLSAERPGRFEELVAATRPDDVAFLIYTSGTTGFPKGAMISHRNVLGQARAAAEATGITGHRHGGLLPAPLPRGRADLLGLPAAPPGHDGELRRGHPHHPGGPARDRTHGVPGRAAHLGEDAGRHPGEDPGDRAAAPRPLRGGHGARDGSAPCAAWPGSGPGRSSASGRGARPPARAPRAAELRRPAPGPGHLLGRRRHLPRGAALLPRHGHPGARGVRDDRVHRLLLRAARGGGPAGDGGARPSPGSSSGWPTTGSCSSAARRSSSATTGTSRPPPRCSRGAGSTPATWPSSTRTATCASSTARRPSS